MPQNWTGQRSAHELWRNINTYVDTYLFHHQHQSTQPWCSKWYESYQTAHLGQSNIPLQVAALVLTENPFSTIIECVHALFEHIPYLRDHLQIHQVAANGNIKYNIATYKFDKNDNEISNVKLEIEREIAEIDSLTEELYKDVKTFDNIVDKIHIHPSKCSDFEDCLKTKMVTLQTFCYNDFCVSSTETQEGLQQN